MSSPEISIRGVGERDIDFLLLEELVSSPSFLKFFLQELNLPEEARLTSIARSVNAANGESDLEFSVQVAGKHVRVLVENKVDALFQERQGERYADRAVGYLRAGDCDETRTVLVAPEGYGTSEAFDVRISYEQVLTWLANEEDGARSRCKEALLREALRKGSEGWVMIPSHRTTGWWRSYWQLANTVAPELGMPQPGLKPATSNFVQFRPTPLATSRGIDLVHKVPYGRVDLQFKRQWEHVEEFSKRYAETLGEGMQIARAGKSIAVRVGVPRLTFDVALAECEEEVRKALEAAQALLAWYMKHRPE